MKKGSPKMQTAAEDKQVGEDVVFSRVVSFSNVLDPTKFFEVGRCKVHIYSIISEKESSLQ